MENYICTQSLQFGFKKQHATDICIYTVKSVIKYYTRQTVLYKTVLYIHVYLLHPKPWTKLVIGFFLGN